jgi:hypothetical protein
MAASPELPDFHELLIELDQLERREREVSALRRRLHDRLNAFPNEVTAERERQISAERRELHREIDLLRARLAPFRLHLEKNLD